MIKIDIFSGFLGAGKTTLIKKLIAEAYSGEKLVLIENEFGDIGIDGSFLQDAGVNITEMNSGCICCSLVGDFGQALEQVIHTYTPDRILIEPSGVGKLSDVIRAVENIGSSEITINALAAVADVNKCKMYMKNFGEFFNNQIENARTILLSHTTNISNEKLAACVEQLRAHNPDAAILTTPWEELNGAQILEVLENRNTLTEELADLTVQAHICPHCGHNHDHDHHHDECCCHDHEHHHDHDECCCHDHEHHHDHDECGCHDHGHHHDHDECGCHDHGHHHDHDECGCHEHEHHHDHDECGCHEHGHHHADEVFTSFGAETGRQYTAEEITEALSALDDRDTYGFILRAKGIVRGDNGFLHFDYVPGEPDVRLGSAVPVGRLCIIGSDIREEALKALFRL